MKIAFDYQIFFLQNYGGISRYFKTIAQELSSLDQQVKIFSGINCNNYLTDLEPTLVKGYKIEHYPNRSVRIVNQLNRFVAGRQISAWQPDILHETYYSNRKTSNTNCARVTTVYDMIHELFPQSFSQEDRTTEMKIAAFNRVDHIISISHSTKADLVRLLGIEESKISVVHLGVDPSFAEHPVIDVNIGQRPFLLYVGGRGGYKNFVSMLEAISKDKRLISDFDIVAFGGGPFSESESKFIGSLGFRPQQVKQISGSDQVLVQLYKEAAAFVYPSLYEGFGLPPLEAMMCKCPVVSSNSSSMPEVIGAAGEYFSPDNTDDICQAISNVVYSSVRRQQLVEAGLERAKLFTWNKCALETLNVYRKLIG